MCYVGPRRKKERRLENQKQQQKPLPPPGSPAAAGSELSFRPEESVASSTPGPASRPGQWADPGNGPRSLTGGTRV